MNKYESMVYKTFYLILILIQVALIILRMTDTIKISWWLVLIPIWFEILDLIVGVIYEIIKAKIWEKKMKRWESDTK